MDMRLKDVFIGRWDTYFTGAELPIVFWYTDDSSSGEQVSTSANHHCLICNLTAVRKGKILRFDSDSVRCGGGKRMLGFVNSFAPNFEYFLSCGIEGTMEGERYKKSPELVREFIKRSSSLSAPAQSIVFKRWDLLEEPDNPAAVVFFATADVLSGLFTLANYDQVEPDGVYAPFTSGCGSIVQYPMIEGGSERPRAILGMFDVSARPCVPSDVLTFTVPMKKFAVMVGNMDESFLTTPSWGKVLKRISHGNPVT